MTFSGAGRQILKSQLKDSAIAAAASAVPAIASGKCQRCGSRQLAVLPDGRHYCRSCIMLGRVTEGDELLRFPAAFFPHNKRVLTWQGQLTSRQEEVSRALLLNYRRKIASLVAAVTGAGKTEILFALLAYCLRRGLRVCVASPRVDVVNELYPRLRAAFTVEAACYHGEEKSSNQCAQLSVCTTHQLLKFYHAFDLLVVDEVDSFPFSGSRMLHYAVANAVKDTSQLVYLTATPPEDLLREVKAGRLSQLRLKRRFHGHLLPVPKEKQFLRPFLQKKKLNANLLSLIVPAVRSHHPLLVFVARIADVAPITEAIRTSRTFQGVRTEGVSAEDNKRTDKVAAFRAGKIKILVTTTILERGVTFKHVWVIVVAADDPIFSKSSLLQIAGRVGRAADDPDGLVIFCYHKYTTAIKEAGREIRRLNR